MPFRYELFLEELLSLVESGEISMARIDDAVERILRVKFVTGLFEHPFTDRSLIELVGCEVFLLLSVAYCDYIYTLLNLRRNSCLKCINSLSRPLVKNKKEEFRHY